MEFFFKLQKKLIELINAREKITYVLHDILIYSKTEEDHLMHEKGVLKVLSRNGLFLNTSKSTFAKPLLEFLGHSIGVNGIEVFSTKAQAIREYPMPITRRDSLNSSIIIINSYRKWQKLRQP